MSETLPVQEKMNMKWVRLFLLWIAAHVITWAATIAFATTLNELELTISDFLSYLFFFLIGAVMGISQLLLLKRPFSITSYEWILLTTIGFGVGFYGLSWAAIRDYYIVFSPPGTPVLEWDPLLGGALLGLGLGCCQGVVWRPRIARMAAWIIGNVFGWSLGMFLPQLVAFQLSIDSNPWFSTLFPVIFGAVVTGLVLICFLEDR